MTSVLLANGTAIECHAVKLEAFGILWCWVHTPYQCVVSHHETGQPFEYRINEPDLLLGPGSWLAQFPLEVAH